MSIGSREARGEQRRLFVVPKAAYATTATTYAAANTLRVRDFKVSFGTKRFEREDNRQSLGEYQDIEGIREGTWSLEADLQGSGAAGTPWACAPFLAAALGTETINGGVSVVYSENDAQNALGWLDFLEELNEVMGREVRNAWLEELTIAWKGGQPHRIMASGGLSDCIFTGSATLDGAHSTSDTVLDIVADEELRLRIGSRIIVGTSNPTSTGHTVSAVDDGNDQITIAPGLASDQDSVIIRPWVPAESAPPSVISGVLGSTTVAGTAFDVTEGEIKIALNLEPNEDEAFKQVVDDYSRSWRKVTGKLKFRAYRDQIVVLQQREDIDARYAMTHVLGANAGDIMTISCPQVLYGFSDIEVPNKGSAMVELPFKAMNSAADTSDAITITKT